MGDSKGRRILVTGALGQIGMELLDALSDKFGAENIVATDIRDSDKLNNSAINFLKLDVLDFESSPPDELKASFALIEKSYLQGKEIREIIGFCPELKNWISLIDKANKQLLYQYKDQLSFRQNYLGEELL